MVGTSEKYFEKVWNIRLTTSLLILASRKTFINQKVWNVKKKSKLEKTTNTPKIKNDFESFPNQLRLF